MGVLGRFLFGRVRFRQNEEYLEFQFKFLSILLITGALFTLLFVVGAHSALNPIAPAHVRAMTIFTGTAFLLWLLLRGHKRRFLAIAWAYEIACLAEYSSALAFVPEDELRILWFYINVPGVYLILGQRAGAAITGLTLIGLALGNPYLSAPYSPNAMATALVSLAYLGMIFHVFANRSISYFVRLQASNRQLSDMAAHDPLTGVLNARAYYAACDRLLALDRRRGAPSAVLFLDLDHFKRINDTWGHAAGDTVLRTVADTVGNTLRRSDVLGRIGGEEFSVFLPNTDANGAVELGEKLRVAIGQLQIPEGETLLSVTVSIGVAQAADQDESLQDIQQRADKAMYAAKAAGRNRVSVLHELEAAAP